MRCVMREYAREKLSKQIFISFFSSHSSFINLVLSNTYFSRLNRGSYVYYPQYFNQGLAIERVSAAMIIAQLNVVLPVYVKILKK